MNTETPRRDDGSHMRLLAVDWNMGRCSGLTPTLWTVGLTDEREYLDPPLVGEIVELWDAESPTRCFAIVTVVRPASYSTEDPPTPYIEFAIDATSWYTKIGTASCEHLSIGPVSEADCPICGELVVR